MNDQPHTHVLDVFNGSHCWVLTYGDVTSTEFYPSRMPWDSDARYARKCQRRLEGLTADLIRRHDAGSRRETVEAQAVDFTRHLDPRRWGSEQ